MGYTYNMNFKEYIALMKETTLVNSTPVKATEETMKGLAPVDLLSKLDPKVWTGRKIDGEIYLYYNEHFLNVSNTKKVMDDLYASNGHAKQGFDKLSEKDLITYSSVKVHLEKLFNSVIGLEVEADDVANYLFKLENFDFTTV